MNCVALPLLVLAVPIICNDAHCPAWPLTGAALPSLDSLFRVDAFVVTLAWFALHALLYFVVPGPVVDGTAIAKLGGAKLKYNCNGVCARDGRECTGHVVPPWALACTSLGG